MLYFNCMRFTAVALLLLMFHFTASDASAIADGDQPQAYFVAGDGSFYATNLKYNIRSAADANNCEFYVNAFGMGHWSRQSVYRNWMDAYLSVNAADLVSKQRGRIVNVGMYAAWKGLNPRTADGAGLFLAREIEPAYYQVRFLFDENDHGEVITELRRRVESFAFFIDIERTDQQVDRLWISQGGANFTIAAVVHGYPTVVKSLGNGMMTFVEGNSPVYAQRAACK